jgi:hypothetical protein
MSQSQASGAPRPVAAVITEWRKNSHADVILSRILEPEAWGHQRPFALRIVSMYADQFPDQGDLCRPMCRKHGVPIFPTIRQGIGVGTSEVSVDGVILIGEHGNYPWNSKEQHLYPRRRLFDGVVSAFRSFGKSVPVFTDKHLSYEWLFARWMYDQARALGFPVLAGSSVPLAWRRPELSLPMGCELTGAFGLGYAGLDSYGFHTLEGFQCMAERRRGGETGVVSVRCLSGQAVWEGAKSGLWSPSLLEALLPARQAANPSAKAVTPRHDDTVFLIRYADGLEAPVAVFPSVGACFGFSGQRKGIDQPDTTIFDLDDGPRHQHFGYLTRAIEHLVVTGRSPYPVERTLLTTGILSASLQSRNEGGTTIRTPHLAEVRYQPVDWPFATGPTGTPA